MTRYFLGVDTGATKSHALIADETGRALGFGAGGSGNPDSVGHDGLVDVLRSIIDQALEVAGLTIEQVAGAGIGIAGYDWPSQRGPLLQTLETLGFGSKPVELVNDALIGLLAGAAAGWGVAVVAGTSCNCWGWDRQRRIGRMTGFSQLFGEAAGGYELVGKAIHAVAAEWTRRGPPTRLTPALIEWAGAQNIEDFLERLSRQSLRISPAAPVVFRVAAEGDRIAYGLVEWAGRELGSMAIGVIRQLEFEDLEFDVVLAGSFYNGSPRIAETMAETVHAVAPGARLTRLTVPPVAGGVLLGMEQIGLDPAPVRETLIQSTKELLITAS